MAYVWRGQAEYKSRNTVGKLRFSNYGVLPGSIAFYPQPPLSRLRLLFYRVSACQSAHTTSPAAP